MTHPKRKKMSLEDESDDESKSPKDQTSVSRDYGLGASSSSHGISAGASISTLVVNPCVRHDASFPLPTRLPSMGALEELANDLYAYSGNLFPWPRGDQYGDVRQDPVWIQEVGQLRP